MTNEEEEDTTDTTTPSPVIMDGDKKNRLWEGTIIRKKKRPHNVLVLAVKPNDDTNTKSRPLYVASDVAQRYNFLHLHCIIRAHYDLRPPSAHSNSGTVNDEEQLHNNNDDEDDTKHNSNNPVMWATDITLLRSTHIPTILPTIIQGVLQGQYPVGVIPGTTRTELRQLYEMPIGRKKRIALAELSRQLEGRPVYKPPKQRLPFVKAHEWHILDQIKEISTTGEHGWTLQPLLPKHYPNITATTTTTVGVVPRGTAAITTTTVENEEVRTDDRDTATTTATINCVSPTTNLPPLNLPPKPSTPPNRGPRPSREYYMLHKKLPQVRWMVQRIQELYSATNEKGGTTTTSTTTLQHILDVGGGRGDLATALALALPSSVHITVVDVNETSLNAGQAYAASILGSTTYQNRITFVLADMVDFCQQEPQQQSSSSHTNNIQHQHPRPQQFDLVVALHACGDLSDFAMAYAQQIHADFIVCPCCYGKKHIAHFVPQWEQYCTDLTVQATLRRLTELNELPHVSRLAMQYINSMRYQAFQHCFDVSLEEYDIQMSIRNHVFVAKYKRNTTHDPTTTTTPINNLFVNHVDNSVSHGSTTLAADSRHKDNDDDDITYEALLHKYSRPVRHRSLVQCCADAIPLVQQVSLVVWFLARYELAAAWETALVHANHNAQDRERIRSMEQRLDIGHAVLLLGFGLVVTLRLIAPKHTVLVEPSSTTKARHRLTDGGLLGVLLRLLASLLRGLTASYSTDTVQSLSLACMVLHLVTCDYTYGTSSSSVSSPLQSSCSPITTDRRPPFQGGTFSLNAVFVAAVLCSSRLQSNVTSYFFCSLAVIMFGFYPATRAELMAQYPPFRSGTYSMCSVCRRKF
jgi:hypothetical protein